MKRPAYRIEYTPEAVEQLKRLRARERAMALDNVERKLAYEPTVATRNRKLLRANDVAPWELRLGTLRVYYDVEPIECVVSVRAVRLKPRGVVLGDGEDMS